MISFGLKTKYCSLKMDNITVINLKALADRVLWCQVLWPRAMLSSQLVASQNVLWYCLYRKHLKIKKSHIKNRRLSLLTACYVVKFYDRVLCCWVSWLQAMLSSFMTACYVVELIGHELLLSSFMTACYDVEFYDRMLWCWVLWPRAMSPSQLTACQTVKTLIACYDVLWYCMYRKCFKETKNLTLQ